MGYEINHDILLQSESKSLALYLCELLQHHDEHEISRYLFSAVENESLPPSTFSIWINISTSTSTLLRALEQDFSIHIRYAAMKRFKKLVRQRDWIQVWNGLGGTLGILKLLSQFSVKEVQRFISCLPRQLDRPENAEQRGEMTELLQGLLPSIYPSSPFKTSDERPLTSIYSMLVPGCTSEFVDGVLQEEKSPLLDGRNKTGIISGHYKLLRRHCLNIVNQIPSYPAHVNKYLDSLFTTSPPLPSQLPRFSESMLFSLDILRKLVARPGLQIPGKSILIHIIEPLIRRVQKKRLPWGDVEEVMDLVIKYLDTHPEEGTHLTFNTGSFIYFSMLFWIRCDPSNRPKFEGYLVSALCNAPHDRHRILRDVRKILKKAPRALRYRLLRIVFLHCPKIMADINSPEGLLDGEGWPCEVFFDVERNEAIELLQRLRNVNKTDNFIRQSSDFAELSILISDSSQTSSFYTSSVLLLVMLEQGKPGSFERSTLLVDQKKNTAAKSRAQEDRAFHAKFALLLAAASGSIALYGETLLWCRRWVRDPLTAKTIFAHRNINNKEAIELLSGWPNVAVEHQPVTLVDVKNKVIEANKVIFAVFETVCLALKEPSFQLSDWEGCLQLMYHVINQRMSPCGELQKQLQNFNEQEIYEAVWSDTLDLALRVEKLSLEPGYESLSHIKPPSPFLASKISPASYRFIDDLAIGRDALWRQYRVSKHPTVTVLPRCMPQGLPIQCLTLSKDLAVEEATGLTPFIHSRAISIIFQSLESASTLVSKEKKTMAAIGSFFDSFESALQIFVLQGSASEMKSRFSRAWTQALENLSYRMAPDEAYRTWRVIFQSALPQIDIPRIDPPQCNAYPKLPYSYENFEWNPAEACKTPPAIESRLLEPQIYLDCSIGTSPATQCGNKFNALPLRTTGFEPDTFNIWSTMRLSKTELEFPAIREGLIISALLYIDSQTHDGGRLLNEPFPSTSNIRYPALWLDMEFMELDGLGLTQAIALFEDKRILSAVPPTLLLKLASAVITDSARLASKDPISHGTNLDGKICKIISLLTRSDRPNLAIDLVLDLIIEYPDASSWHRQLLSNRFLKRLPAEQCQDILSRFSSRVQNKMREQANPHKAPDSNVLAAAPIESKSSYVKITTIKYLAQLMKGASFVSPKFSANILLELLHSSTQIDVRVAVVRSLLEMLDGCSIDSGKSLGDKIISALETLIPVAGGLDERRGLQTEDWELAAREQRLPKVFEEYTFFSGSSHPILPIAEALIEKRFGLYEKHWKVQRVERLIIPIIEHSIKTNGKWVEIFAAKYGLDLAALQLPIVPVQPTLLQHVIHRYIELVPAPLLDLYHHFFLFNISRPQVLTALTKKLEGPEYRDLRETKHWLSMFGESPFTDSNMPFGYLSILSQVKRGGGLSTNPNYITMSQLENIAFSQAQAILFYPDPSQFEVFMSPLRAASIDDYSSSQSAKALIRRIKDVIDSLRTHTWQLDYNRSPAVLPKTLKYQIWLLPYPARETCEPGESQRTADAISQLLDDVLTSEELYHHNLAEFDGTVQATPTVRRVEVACALGQLKQPMQKLDLLRVEIASRFLFSSVLPDDISVINAAKKLVDGWKVSEIEWVRDIGYRCLVKSNFKNSTAQKWVEIFIGNKEDGT